MLNQLVHDVKDTARATARAAVFSTLGAVFALAGVGFLTIALWLLLAAMESALFAATVIGALYCAIGFVLLAMATRGKGKSPYQSPTFQSGRSPESAANTQREPLLQMAEGFAMGMRAGRSARSGRS